MSSEYGTGLGLLSSWPPAVKFETVGDSFTGVILAGQLRHATEYQTGKPKYFDNGDPIMETVLTLWNVRATPGADFDGVETLYISKANMRKAIVQAIKASGARDFELGGIVKVTRAPMVIGDKAHHFTAEYTPAAKSNYDREHIRKLRDKYAPSEDGAAPEPREPEPVKSDALDALKALGAQQVSPSSAQSDKPPF